MVFMLRKYTNKYNQNYSTIVDIDRQLQIIFRGGVVVVTIEEAQDRYFKKFGYFVPRFFELTDDDHEAEWFIKAILKAIEKNKPEINIDGHYDTSVLY